MIFNIFNSNPRKIVCSNTEHGFFFDPGIEFLEINKIYHVRSIEKHEFYTLVYLDEFPHIGFNSSHFNEILPSCAEILSSFQNANIEETSLTPFQCLRKLYVNSNHFDLSLFADIICTLKSDEVLTIGGDEGQILSSQTRHLPLGYISRIDEVTFLLSDFSDDFSLRLE